MIKRIATGREQLETAWQALDKPTRDTLNELERLGYDTPEDVTVGAEDSDAIFCRLYFRRVGADGMTIILAVSGTHSIVRVYGPEITASTGSHLGLTAQQAARWLRERGARP